jgi:hypothetical protein
MESLIKHLVHLLYSNTIEFSPVFSECIGLQPACNNFTADIAKKVWMFASDVSAVQHGHGATLGAVSRNSPKFEDNHKQICGWS